MPLQPILEAAGLAVRPTALPAGMHQIGARRGTSRRSAATPTPVQPADGADAVGCAT